MVYQDGSNLPIPGATIFSEYSKTGTITDLDGAFVLENQEKGIILLKIKSVGFEDLNYTLDLRSAITDRLIIRLEEKIFDLPSILIESATLTGGTKGMDKSHGSAHFIDQKEIQRFSYTDINRTLRNIPGINIQEEDGYGLRPNIGLRATGSERSSKITIMEDGILASPAPYAAPAAYYFPTVGRMHAIEILKGSSQIKFGPYTTGGAINLLSSPIPDHFSGHADFIVGSDAYRMLHANLGNGHKNFSYLVETMQYSADGFKELDHGANTGFNKEDYLAKFKLNSNPDSKFYQSLIFKIAQSKEVSNETYLGLTDEDYSNRPFYRYAGSQKDQMNTKHNQINLTHYIQLSPILDIYTKVYRNEFDRNWYKLDKVGKVGITELLQTPDSYTTEMQVVKGTMDANNALHVKANNRSYYSKGIQSNAFLHFNTEKTSQTLDLGIRLHYDEMDRFQWVDSYDMLNGIIRLSNAGIPGTESNRIESANAFAAYVQYKIQWNQWTFTPGLRYESMTLFKHDYGKSDPARIGSALNHRENSLDVFIPGIGYIYQINTRSNIFGGFHKGFAPPGSSPGAQAEESWNYELGYRWSQEGFRVQILSYLNDYSNLLGSDLAAGGGQGTAELFNGGEAIAKGLELELSYDLITSKIHSFKLPVRLAYTWSEAHFNSSFGSEFEGWGDVENGDHIPYVASHQLSLNMAVEHQKFVFDINGKYSGEMLTKAGKFDDPRVSRTDPGFTIDVALNYRLSEQISAFANVNNATNNIYITSRNPAGVRPNMPRSWNLGLKANF